MTDINYTHIVAILDRSGSMQDIKTDTDGGFNAFIEEQRKQPGKCLVTLVQFDDSYDVVYENKSVADVPPLDLQPRGNTALLDAIGFATRDAGQFFAALPEDERPGAVIVLVLTDGEENASRQYTTEMIKEVIQTQENIYKWVFTFMGSNQNAVTNGASMGFAPSRSITYSTHNAPVAFAAAASMSNSVRSHVSSGAGVQLDSYGYTEAQREEAVHEETSA